MKLGLCIAIAAIVAIGLCVVMAVWKMVATVAFVTVILTGLF